MFSIKSGTENIDILLSFKGYTIMKKLESGSYGSVFKVKKEEDGEIFAAKIMFMGYGKNSIRNEMINNEISIHSIVDHPNIVKFHEAFEISNDKDQKLIVIIQEFCSRGPLFRFINRGYFKNRTKTENKKMIRSIVDAISYLHKMNISHCDIKCENILIDENYNIKICDFGFSKNFNGVHNLTKLGSLLYMAP